MQNNSATPTTPAELDKRIADVMQDIDNDIDDDVTEADENDPALLAELAQLTGANRKPAGAESTRDTRSPVIVLPTTVLSKVAVLKSRLEMYELANKAANEAGELGRARRFERGLQTINELLKKALSGDDINMADIPPEVSMKNVANNDLEAGEEAREDM